MSLLVLTVGTGTAGKHSNLSAGLIATIREMRPRLYWLVPSASPDSLGMADLVRGKIGPDSVFQMWEPDAAYLPISAPDDLLDCRNVLRKVISRAQNELQKGEALIVNPTSGTKQISAGATIAALDEGVGEIVFTVGEGVVHTGTDKLARFDTRLFLEEKALAEAEILYRVGAFRAAAKLLEPHASTLGESLLIAQTMDAWQRLRYQQALSLAQQGRSPALRRAAEHLKTLQKPSEPLITPILGDLLAGAQALESWGLADEALARIYRAAEYAAKLRLAENHRIRPPYRAENLHSLIPVHSNRQDGEVVIGQRLAFDALRALGDAFGRAWTLEIESRIERRNETVLGHGLEAVEPNEVKDLLRILRNVIPPHFPQLMKWWTLEPRPTSLFSPKN